MTLQHPHIIEPKRKFGDVVRGYLLRKTTSVVVLRRFNGFTPAGYVVFRRADVVELTINEKWTQMINAEGHAHLASKLPGFTFDTFDELMNCLLVRDRNISVECENCEGSEESGFHVGRIVKLDRDHFTFVFFDTKGYWFFSTYSIPYASVTKIEFDDPYVDTFSKYIEDCPVPREAAEPSDAPKSPVGRDFKS
jgi:hypothetical protein